MKRSTMFADTKRFNGVEYELYGRFDTKRDAVKMAEKQRKQYGRKARVVPSKMIGGRHVYLVYVFYKKVKHLYY